MTATRANPANLTTSPNAAPQKDGIARTIARVLLGAALVFAGTSHLTTMREEFQAQVPPWLPADQDFVVVVSGWVEITLGLALLITPKRLRPFVGAITAAFFIAIFPGNIAQYIEQRDAFGLNTDEARLIRLFFQPVLVLWAIWSTATFQAWRMRRRSHR